MTGYICIALMVIIFLWAMAEAVRPQEKRVGTGKEWIPFTICVSALGEVKIGSLDDWFKFVKKYSGIYKMDYESAEDYLLQTLRKTGALNFFSFVGAGINLENWLNNKEL